MGLARVNSLVLAAQTLAPSSLVLAAQTLTPSSLVLAAQTLNSRVQEVRTRRCLTSFEPLQEHYRQHRRIRDAPSCSLASNQPHDL